VDSPDGRIDGGELRYVRMTTLELDACFDCIERMAYG
jgi:hypothetical protein